MTWEKAYWILLGLYLFLSGCAYMQNRILRQQGRMVDHLLDTWIPDPVHIAAQVATEEAEQLLREQGHRR